MLEFIGAYLDCLTATAILLQQHILTLVNLISVVMDSPQTSARTCLQLLGHMSTTSFVVKHVRRHTRCLQAWLRTAKIPHRYSLNRRLTMPRRVKDSLTWWTQPKNVCSGVPFQQNSNHDNHDRRFPTRRGGTSMQQCDPRLLVPSGIQP
ncbi:hypothetical protein G0U57_018298, partial [Chelydra serpentina]